MARRVLGGGRVLGSGKNLSPATSTPSPQPKGRLSPSTSSLSLNSQASASASASASQFSPEAQDLASRISLDNAETSISAAPTVSGTQLACPICNEEMVTLLQLNRHLDDAHHNLEEVRQDEVKDWFKAQMDKAKRFQPLAVLNQKLKGLDVFESNENSLPSSVAPTPQVTASVEVRQPDSDEVVTREHWQPRGPFDVCYEPSCGKRLTATNGCVNFRAWDKAFTPEISEVIGSTTVYRDPNKAPTHSQLTDASKVRKRLIDSFAQYDTAARRIRDMPTNSSSQQKLQKAIYQQASSFLHLHMLPLKSLPKILKHATPNGNPSPSASIRSATASPPGNKGHTSALASITYGNNTANGSGQSINSDNSSAISALETEEKTLRERLIVLEEQKFFVSEMIADANRRRRFDEVSSLAVNIEDLSREIDRVNGMLAQLDFEGVYTSNQQHLS
ncbi:vacuolar segregation protein (Pep7), putative [Talaromyces islandicus]|uniref:Vacuolar segregation protein (Pep7), putative n=1 Tax=Talaromyces islandicus TaxID=28573 RepID=A0A0U1LTP6_TALIS|nr:vacuolar segregation protein (Pep7), putative [Talaromyces islandicus]